mgnify:CR=1 FL=1
MPRSAPLVKALALAAATVGLAAGPVAADDFGTIKGRVVWGGAAAPEAKVAVEKDKITKDAEVCGIHGAIVSEDLVVDPATKGVANALVYLVKPSGQNPDALKALLKAEPSVELDQKDCVFIPHLLAMNQEQSLLIKSSDPVGHNVRYNSFGGASMNQMLGPNGTMEPIKLEAERLPFQVNCDIHPWMVAHVAVFDHPYFAVTDKDGSFEIKGVPAGAQHLVVWQEKVGYVNEGKGKGMATDVKAGADTDLGEIKLDPSKVKK